MGEGERMMESEEERGPEEEAFVLEQEQCVRTLGLLEDSFTDPSFLAEVSDFVSKHAISFDDRQEDHPIQWMLLWNEYKALIERSVEGLMSRESLSQADIACFCEYIAEEEPQALVCVDYLLASVDYPAFLELMLEHKELLTCEPKPYIPESRLCLKLEEESDSGGAGGKAEEAANVPGGAASSSKQGETEKPKGETTSAKEEAGKEDNSR